MATSNVSSLASHHQFTTEPSQRVALYARVSTRDKGQDTRISSPSSAKQERIRISERVRAGLTTARNEGKRLGRPRVFVSHSRIESLRQAGKSWREIAQELNTNTATARRAYAAELKPPFSLTISSLLSN